MLKIKLVSRITIASTFLICQMLSSCITGIDTVHSIRVRNCTHDTLIIGGSLYNCIDSVDVFLEASNDTAFYGFTSIDESGHLNIHGNLIYQTRSAELYIRHCLITIIQDTYS